MFIKRKAVGVRRQGLSPVAGWEWAVCQIQPGEEFSGRLCLVSREIKITKKKTNARMEYQMKSICKIILEIGVIFRDKSNDSN
jgi:hypothetical protein